MEITTKQTEFEIHWHYLRVLVKSCIIMQPEIRAAIEFAEKKLGNEWQEKIQKGEFIVLENGK